MRIRTPLTGILAISLISLATSEPRWTPSGAGCEHHQGGRGTSRQPFATLFVDAAKGGVAEAPRDAAGSVRSAGAGAAAARTSLAGRAAAKGLQFSVDISDELPALVVGDPVRLRAALENLIDNAVEIHRTGRRCAGGVAAARSEGQDRCRLRDIRIAASVSTLNEIQRLFRPLLRRRMSASRRRFGGAGLRPVLGQAGRRARWAATSSSRRGATAEPPSRWPSP